MLFIPLILLLISLLVIISTSTLKGKETDLSNQLHRLRGRK
jgi:hypothetical protein